MGVLSRSFCALTLLPVCLFVPVAVPTPSDPRTRCSWLYLLRACLDAEKQIASASGTTGTAANAQGSRCTQIVPPDHAGRLGWGGEDPSRLTDMSRLLFAFRCW